MKKNRLAVPVCCVVLFLSLRFIIEVAHVSIVLSSSVQVLRFLQAFANGCLVGSVLFLLVSFFLFVRKRAVRSLEAHKVHREVVAAHESIKSDPPKLLVRRINLYLTEQMSTPFFEGNLKSLCDSIPTLQQQVVSIRQIAEERFGKDSMSYNQFVMPVEYLLDHMTKLADDMMKKMEVFDEARYQRKIDATGARDSGQVSEYVEVLNSYKEFVKSVVDSAEAATIKLDKLMVEMGKLSNEELKKSIMALRELDTVIVNTKLYKEE